MPESFVQVRARRRLSLSRPPLREGLHDEDPAPPFRRRIPGGRCTAIPIEPPRIGAEVRGVALHGDLPAETFAAIRAALLQHKVLFFRDQVHLDDSAQQRFAALFGELVPHPTVPSRDGTQLLELDSEHGGRANSWHTDVTFDLAYPAVSVLRAVTVPAFGGDTVWANTAAAYQDPAAGTLAPAAYPNAIRFLASLGAVRDHSARTPGRCSGRLVPSLGPAARICVRGAARHVRHTTLRRT